MDKKDFQYPADFVARVKEEFPDWPELHLALDVNVLYVGRYLANASQVVIEADHIVDLLKQGKADELLFQAEQLVKRRALYDEWDQIAYPNRSTKLRA